MEIKKSYLSTKEFIEELKGAGVSISYRMLVHFIQAGKIKASSDPLRSRLYRIHRDEVKRYLDNNI